MRKKAAEPFIKSERRDRRRGPCPPFPMRDEDEKMACERKKRKKSTKPSARNHPYEKKIGGREGAHPFFIGV